ncbi:MAG TPA: MarR family transcriptional regulator [Bacillota bacterium]|nr:MarR family transcriptional regulator [Bacillota bacterium]
MKTYLAVVDEINKKFEQFKVLVLQETKQIEQMAQFQLTPQQEMMMDYIIRHEPVRSNDIALYLNISRSAVSQVLPILEEQKMIDRRVNPSNRRESHIFLGSRGKEYERLLHEIDELLVRKYYSRVSIKDLEHVRDTLQRIVKEVKGDEEL